MSQQLPQNPDELREAYIREGGNPNAYNFQKGEVAAMERARQEVQRREQMIKQNQGQLQRLSADVINGLLRIIAVAFTFIVVLGIGVATIMLIDVEIKAVEKGFAVIDSQYSNSYAVATVFFYIVVSFVGEVIRRSTVDTERRMLSLRYFASWLWYTLGFGKVRIFGLSLGGDFAARYQRRQPLQIQVDNAITWLTWTVVIFGLLGRLGPTLNSVEGNYIEAVGHILTEFTFVEMAGLIGAFVMTMALLAGVHFTTFFMHVMLVQITGGISINFSNGVSEFDAEIFIQQAQARYIRDQILMLQRNKLQRLEATNSDTQPAETTNNTD